MSTHSEVSEAPSRSQSYQLPNGMKVHHLNKHETDFTYHEIFEDNIYFKNGISLENDACVFDIGANIGLFTLYTKHMCPSANVFSFEPAPNLFQILSRNTSTFGSSIQVFQQGISDKEEEVEFTYYPNYSILSGFHGTPEDDEQTLSAGIRNQLQRTMPSGANASNRMVELLTKNKLKDATNFTCQLRSISSVIRESGIKKINLLKIDAEKSESQILAGIADKDWPKIDQIVMESHSKQTSDSITSLLNSKGFKIYAEQEDQFSSSEITNISAIRPRKLS